MLLCLSVVLYCLAMFIGGESLVHFPRAIGISCLVDLSQVGGC